jgi:hypothetical protein|eukprot:COSAG06_NODE_881_length_11798_cov_119.503205_11_plen_237_part_00
MGLEHPASPPPIGPGLDEQGVAAANMSERLLYCVQETAKAASADDGTDTLGAAAAMAMPPWPGAKSAGLQQLRMAWGNAHESTALAAFVAHDNSMAESAKRGGSISVLSETGLWMVDMQRLPPQILDKCPELTDPVRAESQMPPIGASPDAMLAHLPPGSAVDPSSAALVEGDNLTWLPVEVKCICPWWEERGGQGGRKRRGFSLNRTPPHGPVIPVHAAVQVQLQMLACGTNTAV